MWYVYVETGFFWAEYLATEVYRDALDELARLKAKGYNTKLSATKLNANGW